MKHPAASISERSITISPPLFPRWREPTYLLRKLALEWSEPGEEDQVATKATPTVMLFLPRLTPTVMLSLLAAIHNCCANTHVAGEVPLHLNELKVLMLLVFEITMQPFFTYFMTSYGYLVKKASCNRDAQGAPQKHLRRQ